MVSAIAGYVIGAIGALASLVAFFKVGAERKEIAARAEKIGVDSTQVLTSTALALLQPSLEQIAFLRGELSTLRIELIAARNEIAQLRHEIAAAAH